MINYWWQAGLAAVAIIFGIFGMFTAKKWSWLKSGVGQGVFFISLGVVLWGLAQAGWTYYLLKYPTEEVVQSKIIDVVYFASIPLWTYGILKLSKATGAKFGLKKTSGKLLVLGLSLAMIAFSYYFLVIVARGGLDYFSDRTVWISFFDLGYAIGDAINLTIALAIFGLSWKYLGGRFKRPILSILLGFGMIYLADFLFSYYDGQGTYYNGNIVDLLYLLTIATFGLALCLLDPSKEASVLTRMFAKANTDAKIEGEPAIDQIAETDINPQQYETLSQVEAAADGNEPAQNQATQIVNNQQQGGVN